jgi:coatomer subunit beta
VLVLLLLLLFFSPATQIHRFPPPSRYHSKDILLLLVGFIRFGESKHSMWLDNKERILVCINVLTRDEPLWLDLFTVQGRVAFSELLAEQRLAKEADEAKAVKKAVVQADSLICLRQLKPQRAGFANESEDEGDEADLERAAGYTAEEEENAISRKRHIHQMTGYSDLIYAEAFVHLHQFDIVLDVMILNQTSDTLQNLSLELATLGDLKLCERPQAYTVGPHGTVNIKANIKVSSTETGVIFGNLVYDVVGSGASDSNVVVLNDIHIDIMDYILPASCSDTQFRTMWQEFEWENKVVVNTTISDPKQYLQHILKSTNMKCLTPASALAVGIVVFVCVCVCVCLMFGFVFCQSLSNSGTLELAPSLLMHCSLLGRWSHPWCWECVFPVCSSLSRLG